MENSEENLPANLEKLQIGPLSPSSQSLCVAEFNPFGPVRSPLAGAEPSSLSESVFKSLSFIGAKCPTGSCLCNKKKKSQTRVFVQKPVFKRPVLQRGRLGSFSLRAPILRVDGPGAGPVALMRPPLPGMTSHLTSIDLTSARGKILGLDCNSSDFHSLVSINVDVSKLNVKSLSVFEAISFINLRTQRDKHLLVELKRPRRSFSQHRHHHQDRALLHRTRTRRRTYSDSTAVVEASGQRPASSCAVQARLSSPDDTSIDELASYFDLFVHIPKKMSHMAEMMYI